MSQGSSVLSGGCTLSSLKKNHQLCFRIIEHYRQQNLFIVADENSYSVPVRFLGNSAFACDDIVSATYVGVVKSVRKQRRTTRVSYLILENAEKKRDESVQLYNLSKPVCLLISRNRSQVLEISSIFCNFLYSMHSQFFRRS